MTALQQHLKIAVALGYSYEDMRICEEEKDIIVTIRVWKTPEGIRMGKKWPPNYPHDLNAMRVARSSLSERHQAEFWNHLHEMITGHIFWSDDTTDTECFKVMNATAEQQAEAFLKTLNLWED